MRTLIASVVFAVAFGLTLSDATFADDLPFGGDTLRNLTQRAEFIVRVDSPHKFTSPLHEKPKRPEYERYWVTVTKVFRGPLTTFQQIEVVCPPSLDVDKVKDLANAMLFLRTRSPASAPGVEPATPANYLVISGRCGAIPITSKEREDAIMSYLEQRGSGATPNDKFLTWILTWTEKYFLSSGDPFLQKSAAVDLFAERNRAEAVEQLTAALNSDAVPLGLKVTVLNALSASTLPQALESLRDAVENSKLTNSVREAALWRIATMPQGDQALERLGRPAARARRSVIAQYEIWDDRSQIRGDRSPVSRADSRPHAA
jgi:hypothetical protein